MQRRPQRGSLEGYVKIHEQARLQFEYREIGKPVRELLGLVPQRGLARLPEPSPGDIFLDFEADPFVEGGGLEYLLGYVALNEAGEEQYTSMWAVDRPNERKIFESFIDLIIERWSRFPTLHIYHFSHYEPSALKRLMGRYATREDEMDRILRAGLLVDLHGVVKQALRASVERYSLKDLEMFFGFERKTDLRDAKENLRTMECALELNEGAGIPSEVLNTVEAYNKEDCLSTHRLRNWLEEIRHDVVATGNDIGRPVVQAGNPSEAVDERRKRTLALTDRLLRDIPDAPEEHSREERARWLLAHMLEFHRREEKAPWWEFFRLRSLTDEELLDERFATSGLRIVQRLGMSGRSQVDRYAFPQQDTQVREGDQLETSSGTFGIVTAIDIGQRTIDVKKRGAMTEIHPTSVFVHSVVRATDLAESLFRLGTWVADHGIDVAGQHRAARDLLLRNPPRRKVDAFGELYSTHADVVAEAQRIALQLDQGVLPIQGPPGSGKTFTAARMICTLLREHKRVGITAISHKVIRKLLEEVSRAAKVEQVTIRCIEKVADKSEHENPDIRETANNPEVLEALEAGEVQVAAGTAWLWSRPEFAGSVDVLFVDEAGQMSLADVLAVSQAAENLVLLGDPKQLEQPLQGSHPPGVDVSALQHVLDGHATMPPESGLFLSETWRLAPSICNFISELFYDNRLQPHDGLGTQTIMGPTAFAGGGLWFIPVNHEGNQMSSDEEADAVVSTIRDLLQPNVSWIDMNGETHALDWKDILIVAPYNAQVFNLAARLPNAQIGTVDKFQGQEAPVVIYTMTTSSAEDAPRGMEFLYSLNRFNVAISRARCAALLVANARLFEAECQTPQQMRLANALCRYLEMAKTASGI